MKGLSIVLAASAAFAFAPGGAVRAVEVDGVAAVVGSAAILRSDVYEEMARRGIADESRYGEIRNKLIERQLVLKASESSKMTMQDWVVEERVKSIIDEAFDGDRNKLVETLAKQKIPYGDWHRRIKEDLVVNAMRWNVVDKNVKATPSAMRKEYDDHPERYLSGAKATISVILLKPEDAGKRGEVADALKSENFAEVAKKYSSDSRAAEGGVWKDVNPSEVFRPEICAEIDKTPVGTISKWVELNGWWFLLRKDAEAKAAPMSFSDAYDAVAARVRSEASEKLYSEWMDRLKAETYIKVY